ncbi:MAG: hypothetical protein H7318_03010 [Oligoflexus sp.]|nr:hypothetical protein [Oligoflexus sp.]
MKNVRAATQNHTDKFASGNIGILWTDTHKEAEKNPIQLFHDGRASGIHEAVLWHGGEALKVINAYKALTKEQRETLEAFIGDI